MFRARWDGEALTPTGHYGLSAAREAMEPGDVVIVEIDHPARKTRTGTGLPRSMRHGGTFREPAKALGPPARKPFKHALIATGFADTYSIGLWGQRPPGRACPYGAGISGGREARLRDS